jgi:hypothetical protein
MAARVVDTVDAMRKSLCDGIKNSHANDVDGMPSWTWVCSEAMLYIQGYATGSTQAMVAGELHNRWDRKSKPAGGNLKRLMRQEPPTEPLRLSVFCTDANTGDCEGREEKTGEVVSCLLHSKYRSLVEGECPIITVGRRMQFSNYKLTSLPTDDAMRRQLTLLPTDFSSIILQDGSVATEASRASGIDVDDMLLADFSTNFSSLDHMSGSISLVVEIVEIRHLAAGEDGPNCCELPYASCRIELRDSSGLSACPLWLYGQQTVMSTHFTTSEWIGLQYPRTCTLEARAQDSMWLEYEDQKTILYVMRPNNGIQAARTSLQNDRPVALSDLGQHVDAAETSDQVSIGVLCQLRRVSKRNHPVDRNGHRRLTIYVDQPTGVWSACHTLHTDGLRAPVVNTAAIQIEYREDSGAERDCPLTMLQPGQLLWVEGLSREPPHSNYDPGTLSNKRGIMWLCQIGAQWPGALRILSSMKVCT